MHSGNIAKLNKLACCTQLGTLFLPLVHSGNISTINKLACCTQLGTLLLPWCTQSNKYLSLYVLNIYTFYFVGSMRKLSMKGWDILVHIVNTNQRVQATLKSIFRYFWKYFISHVRIVKEFLEVNNTLFFSFKWNNVEFGLGKIILFWIILHCNFFFKVTLQFLNN